MMKIFLVLASCLALASVALGGARKSAAKKNPRWAGVPNPNPPPAWSGRLDWSVHQTMPTGPQDWLGHADLILYDDGQGGVTGKLAGTETQTLGIATCHGVTTWTVDAWLTGTITPSARKITINVTDRQSTRPKMASCGTARTGGDIFMWPHFDEMFQKLAPSADGNSYQSHLPITVSNGTGDCTLILQKSPE